jgi:hypothetical protein
MFDTIRFYEPYDIFRTFYFIFQFLIQIWKHVKFSTNSVFLRPVPARTGPVYRWEPFELRVLVWILNSIGFFWFLVEPVRFTGTSRRRFGTSGREKTLLTRVAGMSAYVGNRLGFASVKVPANLLCPLDGELDPMSRLLVQPFSEWWKRIGYERILWI